MAVDTHAVLAHLFSNLRKVMRRVRTPSMSFTLPCTLLTIVDPIRGETRAARDPQQPQSGSVTLAMERGSAGNVLITASAQHAGRHHCSSLMTGPMVDEYEADWALWDIEAEDAVYRVQFPDDCGPQYFAKHVSLVVDGEAQAAAAEAYPGLRSFFAAVVPAAAAV